MPDLNHEFQDGGTKRGGEEERWHWPCRLLPVSAGNIHMILDDLMMRKTNYTTIMSHDRET